MKQGQTGGKESVSLQHSVKFTGPLLPHKVQGLAGLAASTNTYFSTTINTVEETTAFSLFHTKETEVNRTVFVTLSILIIFHLDGSGSLLSPQTAWMTVGWTRFLCSQ